LKRNPDGESFFGKIAKKVEGRIIVNLSYSQRSLFKQELFVQALDRMIDPCLIEELPLKYAAVSADLKTGDKVVLTSGELKTAVLASSSIPGFLEPVEYGRWELTDGEVSDLVPCMTAKELGADFVIAIDVGEGLTLSHPLENALDIIFRANHIKGRALVETRKKFADVWIRPNVDGFKWSDFDQIDPLVKNGYQAGLSAIPDIRRKLKAKKWRFWERIFR
jgi:NTE family protein